jgi:hypothetical protein
MPKTEGLEPAIKKAATRRKPAAPAPRRRAGKSVAASATDFVEPTREEIAQRAYLLWEARGSGSRDPEADWLQAEADLRAERRRALATARPTDPDRHDA